MDIPSDLYYSKSHEWIRHEGGKKVTVGITEHAQRSLGDVVYVELPEVDQEYSAGDEFGVVESVKAASDLYMPVNGTVVAVNEELDDSPELVNSAPYGEGWIAQVELQDEDDLDQLLSAADYEAYLEEAE